MKFLFAMMIVLSATGCQKSVRGDANDQMGEARATDEGIKPSSEKVVAAREIKEDFDWLNGIWYDDCDQRNPLIRIAVKGEHIRLVMTPYDVALTDPADMETMKIEQREDGSIDLVPSRSSDLFYRVRRDINGHIIGDLYQRFGQNVAPMEAIAATKCSLEGQG